MPRHGPFVRIVNDDGGGSVFPDPYNHDLASVSASLRCALFHDETPSISARDARLLVSIMDAYSYLLTDCTRDRLVEVRRKIRAEESASPTPEDCF